MAIINLRDYYPFYCLLYTSGRPPKADKDKDAASKSKAPAQKPEKAVKKEPEKKTAPTVQTAPTPKEPEKPKDAPRRGKEQIVYIKLNELYAFKNHPFEVRDDEEMPVSYTHLWSMGMPTTSLILFAVATVASSGDCSILRYVSREIPSFSAISRCVKPAYWRACLTVNPKFTPPFVWVREYYTPLLVECRELKVENFKINVDIALLLV